MTGIIAHAAGFHPFEALLIAWASEFTDENDHQVRVFDPATGEVYENYISQTLNILKPKRKLMRIYPVYHFVPGDPEADTARRRDGKMHLLNTTPGNGLAATLLAEALKKTDETRFYRIGIATHAFADTWAHQNFVGWFDAFNGIGMDIKPDIGHADAEHHPDWAGHRWEDPRLVDADIFNTARILDAAQCIYRKFREHLSPKAVAPRTIWELLRDQLLDAMNPPFSGDRNWYRKDRNQAYKDLAPWLGEFDETAWLNQAVEGNFFTGFSWKESISKQETHWYRFQESVKDHQTLAMELLDPIFKKMDLDLDLF